MASQIKLTDGNPSSTALAMEPLKNCWTTDHSGTASVTKATMQSAPANKAEKVRPAVCPKPMTPPSAPQKTWAQKLKRVAVGVAKVAGIVALAGAGFYTGTVGVASALVGFGHGSILLGGVGLACVYVGYVAVRAAVSWAASEYAKIKAAV